jgi:hypothetical protein
VFVFILIFKSSRDDFVKKKPRRAATWTGGPINGNKRRAETDPKEPQGISTSTTVL